MPVHPGLASFQEDILAVSEDLRAQINDAEAEIIYTENRLEAAEFLRGQDPDLFDRCFAGEPTREEAESEISDLRNSIATLNGHLEILDKLAFRITRAIREDSL